MITGKQLRLLRQAKGLVQKELAYKMNIAQQRLSVLEKSTVRISEAHYYKAIRALKYTDEEAQRVVKNIPSRSGGGGKTISTKYTFHFYLLQQTKHVKKLADNSSFFYTGSYICTNYAGRIYKTCC